ncbi:speckle-type POZ protein-like [Daphnia pulex]|uniref:speckle-type POZ protein-like n=1 Tax=Daphnia pulex TaxID=6669 RepID=UPI001EDE062E|nr:speckle-type POZ protein-like [Daphnia pulex]
MEEILNIKADEVRLGLFRIRWIFKTDMFLSQVLGTRQVKTHLCGSRFNHVGLFNLIYSFQPTINKTRKYTATLTVENTACKTDFCENGGNSEKLIIQQLPGSNITDWKIDPLYMWCNCSGWDLTEAFHLIKKNSVDWIISLECDSPIKGIILWIDFGTNTAAEINILNRLGEMFNNQTNCDVHFQFKDLESIGAHANILSTGSPVFAAMFGSSYLESKSRIVIIDDIDPEVFKQLLIFFYTGKAPRLNEKNIVQPLYEVADKYGVVILKKECIKVLQTQLSTENAIDILVWSDFFSITNLFEIAMEFLLENSRELCFQPQWMNFMKNHPELCLQANQRMAALLPPSKKRAI